MLYVVITFLCLSVLLYLLLGGADFGAGILELFSTGRHRVRTRMLTYRTIGPIWEANHMWLVITIVILFVGFPRIYTVISIHLHMPLLLMLMGITGRGTAFIFRHYDAVKDRMQDVYHFIFMYSSAFTPFFLGTIAGAMLSGRIDPAAVDFYTAYVHPWTNTFSLSTGLFTVSICAFLAAVYLSGEAREEGPRQHFLRQARAWNIITVATGAIVFAAAWFEGLPLMRELVTDPRTLAVLVLASLSLLLLWRFLHRGHTVAGRLVAGFQVSMILVAVAYHHFPGLVLLSDGESLSLTGTAATEKTINALGWALVLGSVFILPALFYLVYSFQRAEESLMSEKTPGNDL